MAGVQNATVGVQRAVQAIVDRAKEIITQPLYDSADFTAASVGDTRFFANTIAGVGLLRTNMELAGQLPAPRQLLVQQVSVAPWGTQAVAVASRLVVEDANLFVHQSVLTLTVSDKPYLRGPSVLFPSGMGLEGFAASAVGGAPLEQHAVHSGVAHPSARFNLLRPGQLLKPNENFNVVINIPVALAGLTATIRAYVVLWGLQLRAVQ
jgi:hypothetical protein